MNQAFAFFCELKNKSLIIFGTGSSVEKLNLYMDINSINIKYFVDNEKKKWGKRYNGREIFSPQKLLSEKEGDIIIIVASMFYDDISNQLTNMGFKEGIHYTSSDTYIQNHKKHFEPLFEELYLENVNFTFPLQNRKWLQLFIDDSISGIRFQPNICLDKSVLGFSFASNELGLRGPHNLNGDIVILGNSFAMGYLVDEGRNWYDNISFAERAVNLGLTVGINQLKSLLDFYQRDYFNTVIFLYHPIMWDVTLKMGNRSDEVDLVMNKWKTGILDTLELSLKKYKWFTNGLMNGRLLIYEKEGKKYLLNSKYGYFDFEKNRHEFKDALDILWGMLNRFKHVLFIRVPVKEQIIQAKIHNQSLIELNNNYDFAWKSVVKRLSGLQGVRFFQPNHFQLEDYFPCDTHWNEQGNIKFAKYIDQLIASLQIDTR